MISLSEEELKIIEAKRESGEMCPEWGSLLFVYKDGVIVMVSAKRDTKLDKNGQL